MSNGNGFSSDASKFDVILERMDFQDLQIDEIKKGVDKVTELVADPEKGIYGRVKELETWKNGRSKFWWIFVTALVGLACSGSIWSRFL